MNLKTPWENTDAQMTANVQEIGLAPSLIGVTVKVGVIGNQTNKGIHSIIEHKKVKLCTKKN